MKMLARLLCASVLAFAALPALAQVYSSPDYSRRADQLRQVVPFAQLPAASSVPAGTTAYTTDQGMQVSDGASWTAIGSGGGGAPTSATYIVRTADGTLSNETVMGALATGIVKNTTTTGVPTIAVAGTDYVAPAGNVATASALAANGTNCGAGNYPLGVDASGNAENCTAATGSGDVTGPASSVDSELALMSGTGGKTIKRATTTGVLKATSGVLAAAVSGTDYVVPAGNVATATALAANGANCSAGSAPLGVDASGAVETCTAYQTLDAALTALAAGSDFVQFTGPTTSTKVFTLPNASGTIPVTTGNIATATALAANGANCSAGNYPLGVDASGAVESCTAVGSTTVTTVSISSDTTLSAVTQNVTCDASGASRTTTLPSAASLQGFEVTYKKIDSSANTCTLDANASETIDGGLTAVISVQYNAITVFSNGTALFIK